MLLVRRYAQPRWAIVWFNGRFSSKRLERTRKGGEPTHAGLREIVPELNWTDPETARAAFDAVEGGPPARGHTFWIARGQSVEGA